MIQESAFWKSSCSDLFLYFRVSRVGEPNAIHLNGKDLCRNPLPLLCTSVSWRDITMIHVSLFLLLEYLSWQGEVN